MDRPATFYGLGKHMEAVDLEKLKIEGQVRAPSLSRTVLNT